MPVTGIHTTLVSTDLDRSKRFYSDVLGLSLDEEADGGLTYEVGGGRLYIYPRDTPPSADHTLFTLEVDDVAAFLQDLQGKGVEAETYEGFGQDELGIAVEPNSGRKGAWLTDPDGNILGLFETAA